VPLFDVEALLMDGFCDVEVNDGPLHDQPLPEACPEVLLFPKKVNDCPSQTGELLKALGCGGWETEALTVIVATAVH
jgi:hypothetical protein